MRRYPIPRPTEAAAIGRTKAVAPTAPQVVLAGRLAAAEHHHDRHGHSLLAHLIQRCSE